MGKGNGSTRASSSGAPKGLTANDAFRMLENGGNGRDILNRMRAERNDPYLDWADLTAERTERTERSTTQEIRENPATEQVFNSISSELRKPREVSDADWEETKSRMREVVDTAMTSRDRGVPINDWLRNSRWSLPGYRSLSEKYGENVALRIENSLERLLRKHGR